MLMAAKLKKRAAALRVHTSKRSSRPTRDGGSAITQIATKFFGTCVLNASSAKDGKLTIKWLDAAGKARRIPDPVNVCIHRVGRTPHRYRAHASGSSVTIGVPALPKGEWRMDVLAGEARQPLLGGMIRAAPEHPRLKAGVRVIGTLLGRAKLAEAKLAHAKSGHPAIAHGKRRHNGGAGLHVAEGAPGPMGLAGPMGTQGPMGPQGKPGLIGPQGKPGATGAS